MVKMDLPPLRYPQPVGAAWEPKSFNDSFDFFNIEIFLESFFSFSLGWEKIFRRVHMSTYIKLAREESSLFQIIDLRSFDILVAIARIDCTWTQRH